MKKQCIGLVIVLLLIALLPAHSYAAKRQTKQDEMLQIAQKYDGSLYYQFQSVYKERQQLRLQIKELIKNNANAKSIFINKRLQFETKYRSQLNQLDKDVKVGKITKGQANQTKRQLWIRYMDTNQHFKKIQALYVNIKGANNLNDRATVEMYLAQLLQVERNINNELKQKIKEVKR